MWWYTGRAGAEVLAYCCAPHHGTHHFASQASSSCSSSCRRSCCSRQLQLGSNPVTGRLGALRSVCMPTGEYIAALLSLPLVLLGPGAASSAQPAGGRGGGAHAQQAHGLPGAPAGGPATGRPSAATSSSHCAGRGLWEARTAQQRVPVRVPVSLSGQLGKDVLPFHPLPFCGTEEKGRGFLLAQRPGGLPALGSAAGSQPDQPRRDQEQAQRQQLQQQQLQLQLQPLQVATPGQRQQQQKQQQQQRAVEGAAAAWC